MSADNLEPIDLRHPNVIGVYLLETSDGPALLDCGPTTSLDALKQGLAERGLALTDVRDLLLTHIHLDHAGAAGVLVREHPGLRVHVSEVGAPHLLDPSRLERSARRLWVDDFDTLWGELAPVPEANLHVVGSQVAGLECFATPGHASHHVSYLDNDGTLYAGDAAGLRILPSDFAWPPTPPPDIDVEAWHASLDELEWRGPERLALIHFGIVTRVAPHLAELRARLDLWAERVAAGASEDEFVAAGLRDLDQAAVTNADAYGGAGFLGQNYLGLARWAAKRAEAA
jgi:glyoxylase-like metal-dependent hydrolase (beta-lactamase superfamily II)